MQRACASVPMNTFASGHCSCATAMASSSTHSSLRGVFRCLLARVGRCPVGHHHRPMQWQSFGRFSKIVTFWLFHWLSLVNVETASTGVEVTRRRLITGNLDNSHQSEVITEVAIMHSSYRPIMRRLGLHTEHHQTGTSQLADNKHCPPDSVGKQQQHRVSIDPRPAASIGGRTSRENPLLPSQRRRQ